MPFNSFNFWVIFPLIFLLYWAIPRRMRSLRKGYLIAVSYLLYLNWNPWFSLVLLYVTAVTYLGAIAVEKDRTRQHLTWTLVALTLLPLVTFKYYNFINDSLTQLLEAVHLHFVLPGLNWAIPVGISFFTFQALGYLFDVYRGEERAEHDWADYMLFCSFFPQMASGPISRASELLPQIKAERSFIYEDGVAGLRLVLWGVFLKCCVADRLGLYVDVVYGNYEHFSGANCLWAAILYSLQIYGDFAGYSLMAIGIARTLGFSLVNNFQRPYLAESVSQFWRRWHISLTRWLTRYVYIPLGGSRCSRPRQYANIFVTFLVSGLWHGANWTFVAWGGLHGLAQIGEKHLGLDPKGRLADRRWLRWLRPVRIAVTFLLVTLAWILFRMPTIGDAVDFVGRIFSDHTSQPFMYMATNSDKFFTLLFIGMLFAYEIRSEYLRERTRWMDRTWARWTVYIGLFCIILCCGVLDAGSFIYVNF